MLCFIQNIGLKYRTYTLIAAYRASWRNTSIFWPLSAALQTVRRAGHGSSHYSSFADCLLVIIARRIMPPYLLTFDVDQIGVGLDQGKGKKTAALFHIPRKTDFPSVGIKMFKQAALEVPCLADVNNLVRYQEAIQAPASRRLPVDMLPVKLIRC